MEAFLTNYEVETGSNDYNYINGQTNTKYNVPKNVIKQLYELYGQTHVQYFTNRLEEDELYQAHSLKTRNDENVLTYILQFSYSIDEYGADEVVNMKDIIRKGMMLAAANLQHTLIDYLKLDSPESRMTAVVLYFEQSSDFFPINIDTQYIFSCKLIFPNIRVNGNTIKNMGKFITTKTKLSFDRIVSAAKCLESPSDMCKIVNSTDHYLIGSMEEDYPPYQYQSGYMFKNKDSADYIKYNIKEIVNLSHAPEWRIEEINEKFDSNWHGFIPYLCSPHYCPPAVKISNDVPTPIVRKSIKEAVANKMPKDMELVKQILDCLKRSDCEEYWMWEDIGHAIHTTCHGKEYGLNMWKQFYAGSTRKFDLAWENFESTKQKVSLETLEYFLYTTNESAYWKLKEQEGEDLFNRALQQPTDTVVALLVKFCIPFTFYASNYNSGSWYNFVGNRLVKIEEGNVNILIWEKFRPKLIEKNRELAAKQSDPAYKKELTSITQQSKMINALLLKLEGRYRSSIVSELRLHCVFKHVNFREVEDTNEFFTGCDNGVIDSRNDEVVFRPGKPEDFITKKTVALHLDRYSWSHPMVIECMGYIRKIIPEKEDLDFILAVISGRFRAGNRDKKMFIFTGSGNNGKSIFGNLIGSAFQMYMSHQSSTALCEQKRESDSPTASLIASRASRIAMFKEVGKNRNLDVAYTKEITGMEPMWGRDLFEKGADSISMDITFMPFMMMNETLNINDMQQAIWNRILSYTFGSMFVEPENAPIDEAEQFRTRTFPMEKGLENKIRLFAAPFLWILYQYFPKYIILSKDGLKPPKSIAKFTEDCRKKNDYYQAFLEDHIEKIVSDDIIDQEAYMNVKDVYDCYIKWLKTSPRFSRIQPCDINDFKDQFSKKLAKNFETHPKSRKDIWRGFRMNMGTNVLHANFAANI